MESEMEIFTERPSLLILNEYCLLEIFKFLQLDDSMNLAECCNRLRRVADRAFKIKSMFALNGNMFRKRHNNIDRVFTHIGHNVSWLSIFCGGITTPDLSKIISSCNNLKSLQIHFWRENECQVDSTLHNFDKIELLSLSRCDLGKLKMFLKNFYKLKFLTIADCWNEDEELMTALLNNNPETESLCCIGNELQQYGFDEGFCIFQLIERIPKVERLCLDIYRTVNTTALNQLLTFNGLTKLRLECCNININYVLSGLARKGIMEELELRYIATDDNFFDTVKLFVRLQSLVIEGIGNSKVESSTIWPTNLKRLRLERIKFTHLSFISTIQQLKSLEYMDIRWRSIAKSDVADFKNVAKLSRNILNVMDHGNRKQRLEVILPDDLFDEYDSETQLLVDSKPLRILCSHLYSAIRIHFPGLGVQSVTDVTVLPTY